MAGEKVAIVGRTGAGKSTILLALFKLVDLEAGSIEIDGVDISELSNRLLRRSLTIIPQQPLIFSGTLRENVDPFKDYSDAEITAALRATQMGDFLDSKEGLLTEVSLATLSTGESQLISMARALLTKSKVVCLDEATSNIDYDTENLLHKLLHDKFSDCTVLNVVHRIENILDYDRVIIMSQSTVVENGDPTKLLADSSSHFHHLAQSSGLTSSSETKRVMREFPLKEGSSLSTASRSPPQIEIQPRSYPDSLSRSSSSLGSHRSSRRGSIRRSSRGSGYDVQ
jgi:ATP-binding cassette subfamily C (CFTR/MRP) protein 1